MMHDMIDYFIFLILNCSGIFSGKHTRNPSYFCVKKPTPCNVSIAHNGGQLHCMLKRVKDIEKNRKYYKLTRLGEKKIIRFPLPFIPFLNQTIEDVNFHTALDPVDSKWLVQITAFNRVIKKMTKRMAKMFSDTDFTRADDYIDAFRMHNLQIKYLNRVDLFSNPTMFPDFTDFIYKERYLSDDIFVQSKFAGPCPFLLKLVTKKGHVGFKWKKLRRHLNKYFDFNSALRRALEENEVTLESVVQKEQLYVLYHEENNDMRTIKDYYCQGDFISLLNVTSPISLFVRTHSGDLKVVAIQMDYKNTSTVYTPYSDDFEWQLAKAVVNLGDLNICEALWHLSHVHLSAGVYCTIYKSHLSELHPIYQIMQYHCEGTTPHISLTYGLLVAPQKYGTKLFSISNTGYVNLTIAGHKEFEYKTLGYENILKSHGLYSKKLKYHPFRDDGEVIWVALKRFAKSFTKMFYPNDNDVEGDWELQSFAAQISRDGGDGDPYGGKGNIANFPHLFHTRKDVRTFITQFLWQIAMHSAVNYPLEPWGSFIPLNPTKLYINFHHDKRTIYDALSDRFTTIGAISFSTLLGNVRLNQIFDYYNKIEDRKLQKLVKKYHSYFHNCIQGLLEKRNERRRKKDIMGFQYFEPKWLTNSIHV